MSCALGWWSLMIIHVCIHLFIVWQLTLRVRKKLWSNVNKDFYRETKCLVVYSDAITREPGVSFYKLSWHDPKTRAFLIAWFLPFVCLSHCRLFRLFVFFAITLIHLQPICFSRTQVHLQPICFSRTQFHFQPNQRVSLFLFKVEIKKIWFFFT